MVLLPAAARRLLGLILQIKGLRILPKENTKFPTHRPTVPEEMGVGWVSLKALPLSNPTLLLRRGCGMDDPEVVI